MSKRSRRRARKTNGRQKSDNDPEQNGRQEEKRLTSEPWLSKQTGLRAIGVISLLLAVFTAWQLWPAEGPFRAILWGLGFGVAIWAVFFLSLTFNNWVRGRNNE